MKYLSFFTLFIIVTFSSCSLINQGKELQNLFNCKYSLADVKILKVGEVDVSKLGKGEKLPSDVYFTLLKKVMSQDINSEFEFKIAVYNPTDKPAGSQGMEWKMLIHDEQFSQGAVDSTFLVPPKKTGEFTMKANLNLFKLLNNISIGQLMNLLSENDWKKAWEESGLEIKLKPWYKTGGEIKKYPGYITIKP